MILKLEVLISCMYDKPEELALKSNLKDVKTLVVNQCDTNHELFNVNDNLRIIDTTTRGLSVSRNIAIENSLGDVCLISDNDEKFVDGLEQIIIDAYRELPTADIIAFKIKGKNIFNSSVKKLKKYETLKIPSWMITFKRKSVLGIIKFDKLLGAGTGNGAGEENKFMLDCYNAGLEMYYVDRLIGEFREEVPESTWFKGFNKKHFYNQGRTCRYVMGFPVAFVFGFYTLIKNYNNFKEEISFFDSFWFYYKGLFDKKIGA